MIQQLRNGLHTVQIGLQAVRTAYEYRQDVAPRAVLGAIRLGAKLLEETPGRSAQVALDLALAQRALAADPERLKKATSEILEHGARLPRAIFATSWHPA